MALDEAGIVDLSNERTEDDIRKGLKASPMPTATGGLGKLDVGWVNSRGSRIERDMESELWDGARKFLEGVVKEEQGEK